MQLTRRSFVKSATVAMAAVAFGTTLAGCTSKTDPSDKPADTGEADGLAARSRWDYYTTQCHGCITACPVKVYVDDGVVVKIEGHPYGDISQGALCVKGLNQIHTTYSPRHVLYPMRRTGARGAENMAFERVSWDEAINEAAENIVSIMEKYGTYSMLATTGGGGAYVPAPLPPMVMASLFCPNAYEPGAAQCYLPRTTVAGFMGMSAQSMADGNVGEPWKSLGPQNKAAGMKNDTEVLVLWGTQPSCSQTARAGRGMADMRAQGCKTVVVDPQFTADAAKATVHLPLRPGSDAALLLSWFRYIFENKLYDEEFTKYWTNLPCLIDPDTYLPIYAKDAFPDFVQPEGIPENTPVYVCVDETTGKVVPLPYGAPNDVKKQVNPSIFATGTVNGKECKSGGQYYKEEAEPWTLKRAEEFCWVPADRNEEAIKIYTAPLAEGKCAGIVHGVATDMMECSSQAPLGCMGLDAIMGYVNKPGCTCIGSGGMGFFGGAGEPLKGTNQWGKCKADGEEARPTASYGGTHGYGYVIGATEEENRARVAAQNPAAHDAFATLVKDRLGLTHHRGLTSWNQSHIPAVREAMETGEPWPILVWMEFSGNKFCCAGSAGAWYNAAVNNLQYVTHQYANFTSFDAELTDMFFPTEEWLEMANASGMGSSTSTFASAPIIHLGETVNPCRPYTRLCDAIYEKANAKLDSIVFGGNGKTIAELGLTFPLTSIDMMALFGGGDLPTDDGAAGEGAPAGAAPSGEEASAPAGMVMPAGGDDTPSSSDASELKTQIMSMAAALGLDPMMATEEEYLAAVKNNPKAFSVGDPTELNTYGQHLVLANDGLPKGFATESRKVEVYCTVHVQNAATGFPYNWPEPFEEPVDSRVATWNGTYAPICSVPLQKEAPEVPNSDGFIMDYDADFPLALTSGRRVFFHHGTMRHAPFSRELYPVPFAYINPATAAEYGVADGDWIEISSRRTAGTDYDIAHRGTERAYDLEKDHTTKTAEPIRTIAYVTEMVAPKVVWMERYWNPECFDKSQAKKTGGWQEMSVNVLTNAVDCNFNEVYGSYTNRGFAVSIKKSTRPDNVWVTPEEFEPFMPTAENQTEDSIGVLIENKGVSNHFTDFNY